MIQKPSFDVMKYTEAIEGTPYLDVAEDVPESIRKEVEIFVRDFNRETLDMEMGGSS